MHKAATRPPVLFLCLKFATKFSHITPLYILATITKRTNIEAMARGELDNLAGAVKPLDLEEFPEYRDRIIYRPGG
ncbi:MAG: hypothetical protein V1791_09000 [Pseudomonadota bacterium]